MTNVIIINLYKKRLRRDAVDIADRNKMRFIPNFSPDETASLLKIPKLINKSITNKMINRPSKKRAKK